MRLTDHTDYSLRVLMYLNKTKRLVTLNELSEVLRISRNNLIKVSRHLSRHELIETTRGRHGGLMIQQRAGTVSLKEIIRKTEENFALAECFCSTKVDCGFLKHCDLKKSLSDALEAFFSSLEKTTLNDIS